LIVECAAIVLSINRCQIRRREQVASNRASAALISLHSGGRRRMIKRIFNYID
jgi:hypothetical protein